MQRGGQVHPAGVRENSSGSRARLYEWLDTALLEGLVRISASTACMKGNVNKRPWVSLGLLALIGGFFAVATVPVSPAQASTCVLTFTNKTTANGLGSNILTGVYAVGSTVYAATSAGLSISTDGGENFTNKTTSDGLLNICLLYTSDAADE